jgi:uracil-DNA glycosylase family protein
MSAEQRPKLAELRQEAAACRACDLWKPATQTVFGEGPENADLVFVGEQPGDQEDRAGKPFVGPAGQIFDGALAEAGIDRSRAYVTNAVKHFKFEARGKFRLHKKPNAGEIKICRRWLFAELEALNPVFVVALGATAAQSLLGRPMPVLANRGRVIDSAEGRHVFLTVHPSSLLRAPDEAARDQAYADFVRDLKALHALADRGGPADRQASLFG